ncbi:MAG: hypothetical protein R3Y23_03535 [Bacillota bacterium]
MKNFIKSLIVIMLIFSVAMVVVGCNETSTYQGEITIEISSAEDLQNISTQLGADYSEATFKLTADIDLSDINWQPIGDSITNSFTGTFDGNGYTISNLTIGDTTTSTEGVDDLETVYTATETSYIGLFGYSNGATFSDVTLTYEYRFSTLFDNTYVGGIVGYAYGDNSYTDIDVSGSVDAIYAMNKVYSSTTGNPTYTNDGYIYIGGVVGYGVGVTTINTVTTSLKCDILSNDLKDIADTNINTGDNKTFDRYSRFDTAMSGAVAGYIRNINISDSCTETRNTIANVTAYYTLNAEIEISHTGAVIGSIHNGDITNVTVQEGSVTTLDAAVRTYAGGIAGVMANSTLITATSDMDSITVIHSESGTTLSSSATSFVAGGAVGYMSNNSLVKNTTIATDLYSGVDAIKYGGGLVGYMRDSTLTDSSVTGTTYIVGSRTTVDFYTYAVNSAYTYHIGGAVGLLYGMSDASQADNSADLSGLTVDFTAYQGIVASVETRAEVVEGDPDENGDATYTNYYYDPIVDNATCTYNPDVVISYGLDIPAALVPDNKIGTAVATTLE